VLFGRWGSLQKKLPWCRVRALAHGELEPSRRRIADNTALVVCRLVETKTRNVELAESSCSDEKARSHLRREQIDKQNPRLHTLQFTAAQGLGESLHWLHAFKAFACTWSRKL
jgi:hypothetical protein